MIPSNVVNKKLYARVKAEAKRKFAVYPSIYANAWLVREYKKRGGTYRGARRNGEPPTPADMGRWEPAHERDALRIERGDYDRVVPVTVHASTGEPFALRVYLIEDQSADWVLRAMDGSVAGFGNLEGDGERYAVSYARLRDTQQRKGLYPQVLLALRAVVGPLQSDWSRTTGAERVWQKLGAEFVPGEHGAPGRYKLNPGLRKWFDEQWVDLARPLKGGGWAPCGRKSARGSKWKEHYPKCVPLAKAEAMTPAQRKSAVRRKRSAMKKAQRGRPTYVRTYANNGEKPMSRYAKNGTNLLPIVVGAAAIGAVYYLLTRKDAAETVGDGATKKDAAAGGAATPTSSDPIQAKADVLARDTSVLIGKGLPKGFKAPLTLKWSPEGKAVAIEEIPENKQFGDLLKQLPQAAQDFFVTYLFQTFLPLLSQDPTKFDLPKTGRVYTSYTDCYGTGPLDLNQLVKGAAPPGGRPAGAVTTTAAPRVIAPVVKK